MEDGDLAGAGKEETVRPALSCYRREYDLCQGCRRASFRGTARDTIYLILAHCSRAHSSSQETNQHRPPDHLRCSRILSINISEDNSIAIKAIFRFKSRPARSAGPSNDSCHGSVLTGGRSCPSILDTHSACSTPLRCSLGGEPTGHQSHLNRPPDHLRCGWLIQQKEQRNAALYAIQAAIEASKLQLKLRPALRSGHIERLTWCWLAASGRSRPSDVGSEEAKTEEHHSTPAR